MTSGLESFARGLHADQLDLGIGHERDEDPDRVRSAADARDHALRKPAGLLGDLRARLVADHALQVADECGIGRRADARADDVVAAADVGHPVADRRRDGLLERSRAGVDGLDARAKQPHPLDVGLLAAHVLGTHVDHAFEVEQRAGRGGGHAVLAGARLGDDPALAHPLGQQRLADRVVDLVRAGVVEVLALEIDLMPGRLAQARGAIQRRRPTDVALPGARSARPGTRGPRAPAPTLPRAPASAGMSVSGTYCPP